MRITAVAWLDARITAVAWLDATRHIEIVPPRSFVPWVIDVEHELSLHVADRATLTGLRDALTAALDANPEAS